MTSNLEKLRLIPVNKTVVFYSPIEGKDVLVRTGIIDDENSFLHSIVHAYSKEYISMNYDGKKEFVNTLRESLSKDLDKKKWETISGNMIVKIPFQENVSNMLAGIYYFLKSGKTRTKNIRNIIKKVISDKNIEAYKLISEMIPLEKGFEKHILPQAFEKSEDKSMDKSKSIIIKYSTNYCEKLFDSMKYQLDENRINNYVDKLRFLMLNIVDEAESITYNNYVKSRKNTSIDIDLNLINYISEKFNRDLYFIDSSIRLPYMENKHKIEKRKSIILMWTGNSHYEVVGRLLPGNRIQREFDYKDKIIDTIYTFLYKPVNIPTKYPLLTSYLSKDIRKKIGIEISDSEEIRNSDHYKSDNDGKYIDSDSSEYYDSKSDKSDVNNKSEKYINKSESDESESDESER